MGGIIQSPIYVISNEQNVNGAVSMLYGDNLHELAQRLGDDLYIMPLSVHEVMAVPSGGTAPEKLAKLVWENNMSRISLSERLSNQVYRYDRRQQRLSLATDTPDKRLDGNGMGHDRTDGKEQTR